MTKFDLIIGMSENERKEFAFLDETNPWFYNLDDKLHNGNYTLPIGPPSIEDVKRINETLSKMEFEYNFIRESYKRNRK